MIGSEYPIDKLLKMKETEVPVVLKGFVRTRRDSKGGFSFIEINDGSTVKNIQAVAPASLSNYHTEILKLHAGASIIIDGFLVASQGKGQSVEIRAEKVTVLGLSPEDYPLQKKQHSYEYLREIAHLRPRTNTFGCIARIRNSMSYAIHRFFQERGYLYVHTPIITASDCEGAGQMFKVTTLDLMNVPKNDSGVDYSRDFFGKPAHLTVSGQLEGEIYATALGKIYTFGPTFRAENSNTSRHLSEFWMIEPETAFCDITANQDLAEAFIKFILKEILTNNGDDMSFFNDRIDKTIINRLEHIVSTPFERITYSEAVKHLEESGEHFDFQVEWGIDLQSEHERFLTEKKFGKPIIVTDYPKGIKAFYMRMNEDGKTVRAMDVLVPGIGEIIGGSQREERYDVLLSRISELCLKEEDYWWYLDLRKYGTVPHSGFGLGFERAIQFVTGMENIRDVIPFPRTPKNAEF